MASAPDTPSPSATLSPLDTTKGRLGFDPVPIASMSLSARNRLDTYQTEARERTLPAHAGERDLTSSGRRADLLEAQRVSRSRLGFSRSEDGRTQREPSSATQQRDVVTAKIGERSRLGMLAERDPPSARLRSNVTEAKVEERARLGMILDKRDRTTPDEWMRVRAKAADTRARCGTNMDVDRVNAFRGFSVMERDVASEAQRNEAKQDQVERRARLGMHNERDAPTAAQRRSVTDGKVEERARLGMFSPRHKEYRTFALPVAREAATNDKLGERARLGFLAERSHLSDTQRSVLREDKFDSRARLGWLDDTLKSCRARLSGQQRDAWNEGCKENRSRLGMLSARQTPRQHNRPNSAPAQSRPPAGCPSVRPTRDSPRLSRNAVRV